jgi:hypothetical protein
LSIPCLAVQRSLGIRLVSRSATWGGDRDETIGFEVATNLLLAANSGNTATFANPVQEAALDLLEGG